ncbi:MAG: radical SAM family heme chaperone HemW [Candidatus Gracilibacteria bacterium]|nr:radical SAM family heme chaperone HemW [Candidatus Gracilibacteria bacterium]
MFSYIHIPFCSSKCKYCRFASTASLDKLKIQTYTEKLINEIENFNRPLSKESGLKSVYFGGGTPSVLDIKQISKILETLKTKFGFEENIEITLESTPQNINSKNLVSWNNLGINRLSMGVQTLNEDSLKEIGRDDKSVILKALDEVKKINPPAFNHSLKEGGLINISLDFIIGLPHTKKGETKKDIEYILENYPFIKHISVYMLEDHYYNFETILSEDDYLQEYNEVRDFLNTRGFNFYELSNSAQDGYECKHNIAYWKHSEMLAFGLGTHGFVNNTRYSNSETFKGYYAGKIEEEKLTENDIFLEKIMFDIRTNGISIEFLEKLNKNKIEEFLETGFLEMKDDKLILTKKSYSLGDFIIREII